MLDRITSRRERRALAGAVGALLAMTGVEARSADLAWIEGCWEASGDTREVWVRGADTLVFGFNVVLGEDGVRFFEEMRLEREGGRWSLAVAPFGREWVLFEQASKGDGRAVFENASNDFPQRIAYARNGALLEAEISLLDGSNTRRWNFERCAEEPGP